MCPYLILHPTNKTIYFCQHSYSLFQSDIHPLSELDYWHSASVVKQVVSPWNLSHTCSGRIELIRGVQANFEDLCTSEQVAFGCAHSLWSFLISSGQILRCWAPRSPVEVCRNCRSSVPLHRLDCPAWARTHRIGLRGRKIPMQNFSPSVQWKVQFISFWRRSQS